MKTIKHIFALLLMTTLFFSCSDDDNPVAVNEEEVITTVRFVLSPTGGGSSVVFQSQDLDGDGPEPPEVTVTGTILASTAYTTAIQFINELEDPAEDITLEVAEESDEHQVFYDIDGSSGSTMAYDNVDVDSDGNPVGLFGVFNSGTAATGNTLTITLRHEPNKNADGVSEGNITNAGGETDVEVSFEYSVSN